jgi:cobalamin biosynthesis Mg chelatase CobN
MDDTYVSSNNLGVLSAITTGVCNFLDGLDSNAVCAGKSLVASSDRRRRLAAGEWVATVSVTASSNNQRAQLLAQVNDASTASELASIITTTLQNAGHGSAISSTLTASSSSGDDSSSDDDNTMIIVAVVAGGVGLIALVGIFFVCRISKAREYDISTSGTRLGGQIGRSAVPTGFGHSDDFGVLEGPGADDL